MRCWVQFILPVLAALAFGYAPVRHPGGLFTTNATVWFTGNIAQESAQVYRDGAGNIVHRTWGTPSESISQAALAAGGALLEASPTLHVAAANASESPWTPLVVSGALGGYAPYSEGGTSGDMTNSALVSAGPTYAVSPFPITGTPSQLAAQGSQSYQMGEMLPNGNLAGVGPGAMYSSEPTISLVAQTIGEMLTPGFA